MALEDARQDVWAGYLKQVADADGSGFVSTTEARELRTCVELAYLLAQMAKVPTLAELAQSLNEPVAQVTADLAAYLKLRDRTIRDGMKGLPDLPQEFMNVA